MKRKDFIDVDDDFFFPSYKSRRLDAELCATVNENPKNAHQVFDQIPAPSTAVIETYDEKAIVPSGDEKALVLYNPAMARLLKAPASKEFSIIVNSDLVPGLKDRILSSWGSSKSVKLVEDHPAEEQKREDSNCCMAVVPWVESKFSLPSSREETPAASQAEPMEAEEVEMMETDDVGYNPVEVSSFGGVMMAGPSGLPQWHQPQVHWMNPQQQQNNFAPVT